MPEEWGIRSVGPTSCKRLTVKSTLFCSAAERPFHHSPNSLKNSPSQAKIHYVIQGIMSSKAYGIEIEEDRRRCSRRLAWHCARKTDRKPRSARFECGWHRVRPASLSQEGPASARLQSRRAREYAPAQLRKPTRSGQGTGTCKSWQWKMRYFSGVCSQARQ